MRQVLCRLGFGVVATAVLVGVVSAQGQTPYLFHGNGHEVLLDLVVVDAHGKLVRDLRSEEVEVQDDGAPQAVRSFRLVSEAVHLGMPERPGVALGTTPGTTLDATPTAQTAPAAVNLVVLLFDRLDPRSRAEARRGAEDFIAKELGPHDYAAVFQSDLALRTVQPFTRDRARVTAAVDRVLAETATRIEENSASTRAADSQAQAAAGAAATSIAGVGRGSSAGQILVAAEAVNTAKLDSMLADAVTSANQLDTELSSRTSITHLLGLVNALGRYAGRKTLLYFTDQVQVTSNTAPVFHAAMATANRAQVAVYVLDPSGLSIEAENAKMEASLAQSGDVSFEQQIKRNRAVTRDEALLSQTTEAIGYQNRLGVLRNLAESTGGALIANTNDLRPGLARVGDDIRSHYELAYSPTNAVEDGRFHALTVRVTRPHVTVQARSGYYAVPALRDPIFPFEAPLFRFRLQRPAPTAIDFNQELLQFPETGASATVDLLVDLPLGAFATHPVAEHRRATHFSVMALIRDPAGEVVRKLSQDYSFAVAGDLTKRNLLFEHAARLPAGRYMVETTVYEPETQKATVRRSALLVLPAPPAMPRLSSIVTVERTSPMLAADTSGSPLIFDKLRILPSVDQAIHPKAGGEVAFYMVAYLPPGGPKPTLDVVFRRDGKLMARTEPVLGQPDAAGRLPLLMGVPARSFPPGSYEAECVLRVGSQAAAQTAVFDVAP